MMNRLEENIKPIQKRWGKSNLIQEKAVISSYTVSIGTVLFLIEIVHDHRIYLGRKQIQKRTILFTKLVIKHFMVEDIRQYINRIT